MIVTQNPSGAVSVRASDQLPVGGCLMSHCLTQLLHADPPTMSCEKSELLSLSTCDLSALFYEEHICDDRHLIGGLPAELQTRRSIDVCAVRL
jgi:hypothetical protein